MFLRYLTSKPTAIRTQSSAAVVGVSLGAASPLWLMALPAAAASSVPMSSTGAHLSPNAALSEISSPNSSGGSDRKDEQNCGVLWPNQNELISTEAVAAVPLCRGGRQGLDVVQPPISASLHIAALEKRTMINAIKEHCALFNEDYKKQSTTVGMFCCLLEERYLW